MRMRSPSTNVDLLRIKLDLEIERRRRQEEETGKDDAAYDAEFARCASEVSYFIDNYLIIDDAQGDTGGTMPFHLWPEQRIALDQLVSERLVIFLKARQLGISWLCLAYALWLMLFHPGKVVLLFSQGEVEASEMLRRLKAMYERLPTWMFGRLHARVRDNASEQGWSNGSWCKCLPATQRAGRSFTASLVIMDEAAHQQWGGKLYAALKPTIDAGGKLFVVSSANGTDGFFDELWRKASAGLSSFKAIFLPWWSRPGRDQVWYDQQVADSADPELIKQEYPSNPIEAFVSSGRHRFLNEWVASQYVNISDPVRPDLIPDALRSIDGLRIYEVPEPRQDGHGAMRDGQPVRLIISADVAEGLEHGDYSAAVLIDIDRLDEISCLHGRWEPDEFAVRLGALAEAYDARILVERNNHGHAVLSKLRTLCNWRIMNGPDEREGWLTGVVTKPIAIDALAVGLRDRQITIRSRMALAEMEIYSVMANGKTSAPSGKYDDIVMAWANAMGWRQMVGWKVAGTPLLGGPDRHLINPMIPAPPRDGYPGGMPGHPHIPGVVPGQTFGRPNVYQPQPGQFGPSRPSDVPPYRR